MSNQKFEVGDKVSFKFLEANHPEIGADDKKYKGVVAYVQFNGNLSIDFTQDGNERQISLPAAEVTKV